MSEQCYTRAVVLYNGPLDGKVCHFDENLTSFCHRRNITARKVECFYYEDLGEVEVDAKRNVMPQLRLVRVAIQQI